MNNDKEFKIFLGNYINEITNIIEEKNELKNYIAEANELVKLSDPWTYSDKEIDNEMAKLLTVLNDNIDTKPTSTSISSHRRFIGKIIVLIKKVFFKIMKPYTNVILEKQRYFNEKTVRFLLLSFIRYRKIEEKIKELELKSEELKFLTETNSLEINKIKE